MDALFSALNQTISNFKNYLCLIDIELRNML